MGGSRVPDPELYELTFPHRILQYEYRPDSAGAGKWRGGYGALFSLRFNEDGSALSVQIGSGAEETAPFGLAGGSPAAAGTVRVRSGDDEEVEFHRAAMHHPRGGDVAEIRSAGGGGYGNPYERPVEAVLDDVAAELLSPENARTQYGVVVDPETGAADMDATRKLREGHRSEDGASGC